MLRRTDEDEVITAILTEARTPRLVDNMDGINPTPEDWRCAIAAWVLGLLKIPDPQEH